jgi:selenide,water dikinase
MGDAGVYAIDGERALVQTVDILTPIADDPYTFGQIAAANSLSDIYAMGGKPLTVLNIVGFPTDLDLAILETILEGGSAKVKEAGAVVLGGHTIKDRELKYGLAVTGMVRRDDVVDNDGARPGDKLILTKPIGTGIIATALKAEVASDDAVEKINDSMSQLNDSASEAMMRRGVSACTDVTGFGLLGHALEMATASQVSMRIYADLVPVFDEAREYAQRGLVPGGTKANYEWIRPNLESKTSQDESALLLLCDAQTSGGLLIAVPDGKADSLSRDLTSRGVKSAFIGDVTDSLPTKIVIS